MIRTSFKVDLSKALAKLREQQMLDLIKEQSSFTGDQVLAILQPGKEDELRRVLLKS